jgi:hypothetical protein
MICRAIGVALAILLTASTAWGQLPQDTSGTVPYWPNQVHNWIKKAQFARTVTVDASGAGRYSTIAAALTYVTAQTRSSVWTILVAPGSYTEAALTIPSYTQVRCMTGSLSGLAQRYGTGPCQILSTAVGASPPITLTGDGSGLHGFVLRHSTEEPTWTAAPVMIAKSGGGDSEISNLSIWALGNAGSRAVTTVSVSGSLSTLYASEIGIYSGLTSATSTTIYKTASGGSLAIYGGRITLGAAAYDKCIHHTGDGLTRVLWARVDPTACTLDLDNDGSGGLEVWGTGYDTQEGTITWIDAASATVPGILKFGSASTLPASCTVPSLAQVTSTVAGLCGTAPCLCSCTAANTWGCVGLDATP